MAALVFNLGWGGKIELMTFFFWLLDIIDHNNRTIPKTLFMIYGERVPHLNKQKRNINTKRYTFRKAATEPNMRKYILSKWLLNVYDYLYTFCGIV